MDEGTHQRVFIDDNTLWNYSAVCILAHTHQQLRMAESYWYYPWHPKAMPAPGCPRHTGSGRIWTKQVGTILVHGSWWPHRTNRTEGDGCRMNGSDQAIGSSKQD